MDNDICWDCGINPVHLDGVCTECYADLLSTWNKLDDWLMGNV